MIHQVLPWSLSWYYPLYTTEALPAIVESVVGKAVGFVAEHTWALIVSVVGLIGL